MPESLDDVLARIADGAPVDWDQAARLAGEPDDRELLAQLRVLEQLGGIHRSSQGDVTPSHEPTDVEPLAPDESRTSTARRWGRYLLLGKVGEGGFGAVFRARDTDLNRDLAIKLLHQGGAVRGPLRARLLREAKDLAKVRHPNVVAIYGVEEHDGQVGLCMEFIEGQTLEDRVRLDGPLNAAEALVVGQAVARGLAAIHQVGLLHRDVKAKNVMRERAGRFVLMDLGAGLDTGDPDRMSRSGAVGTPLYMAPEVLLEGRSSVRSDVYSLGVLLYFLVTGRYPVEAESADGMRAAHAAGRRVSLSERRLDLPDAFVRATENALASDAAQRVGSCQALLRALVEGAGSADSLPPPRHQHGAHVASLKTAVLIVGALAMLTVVAFASGILTSWTFDRVTGRLGALGVRQWNEDLTMGFRSLKLPALVGVLAGAMLNLVHAIRSRVARRHRGSARPGSEEVVRPVLAVAIASVLMSAVLFNYFADVFAAFSEPLSTADPSVFAVLGPLGRGRIAQYRLAFSVGLAGLAALMVMVAKPRRPHGLRPSPLLLAAGVLALCVPAALLQAPYRLMYENALPVVSMGAAQCYKLGESADHVRLYCPDTAPPRVRTVALAGASIVECGFVESIFASTRLSCPK